MQLDILFFYNITIRNNYPIRLNYSNIHDELKNFDNNVYPEVDRVFTMFRKMIYEVYNLYYTQGKILGWVTGLHRIFNFKEVKHPVLYKRIPFIGNFPFSDYQDLLNKYDTILTLTIPNDRQTNFFNHPKINFFNDCIPKFYNTFIPVVMKAYNYINAEGEILTEYDIPPINLYIGRLLADNNLDKIPELWS